MRHRLVIATTALALVALLAGCSDDDSTSTDTTAVESTNTTRAEPESSVVVVTPSTAAAAVVGTASNPLGEILVDADGMTLYVFLNDTDETSTCVDACAQAWPPLVPGATQVVNPPFSNIARPDGSLQVAVNGRPLYRFAGDAKPGDTAGQGLNSLWYVAGADGQPIDDSATGD